MGGQPGLRKKNVSVGLFSTFRHPLDHDMIVVDLYTVMCGQVVDHVVTVTRLL